MNARALEKVLIQKAPKRNPRVRIRDSAHRTTVFFKTSQPKAVVYFSKCTLVLVSPDNKMYGVVNHAMPSTLKKKPRVLKNKSIKSRTGAAAQSKQISALSRQLTDMSRKQFAKVSTVWQRDLLSVETTTGGVQAYICPIPYVAGNPLGAGQANAVPVPWTDNLSLASQASFVKSTCFGVAREAATSNEIYHTGGNIKWQMVSNEPTMAKYYMYLIRPKKHLADQLVKDRNFKSGVLLNPTPGAGSSLTGNLDYIAHQEGLAGGTLFGAQINRKYWDVLYSKEITMGHNNVTGAQVTVNYNAPGSSAHTALTARGTIKLPAGGMIKNAAVATQQGGTNASQATSWEVGYVDQENEAGCYLVVINNGISLDGEAGKLGFLVHDYYKACV